MKLVYWLERDSEVKMLIFDVNGRRLAALNAQGRAGGGNQIEIDLTSYPPGVYYYILEIRGALGTSERYRPKKFAIE